MASRPAERIRQGSRRRGTRVSEDCFAGGKTQPGSADLRSADAAERNTVTISPMGADLTSALGLSEILMFSAAESRIVPA